MSNLLTSVWFSCLCRVNECYCPHIQLLQTTIQQLLPITASNLDEVNNLFHVSLIIVTPSFLHALPFQLQGFDVHLILNKNIMLRSCYVTDIAGMYTVINSDYPKLPASAQGK